MASQDPSEISNKHILIISRTHLHHAIPEEKAMQFLTGKLRGQTGVVATSSYRDVLFDQNAAILRLVPGEELLLTVEDVEDTKAGKYERGRLKVTTLRVIWTSSQHSSVNLCIGLQTINKLDVSNKLRSDVPPLHMLSMHKTTKFEFIFTPLTRAKSHELLQTVDVLMREFNATTKYREVRMRAYVTSNTDSGKELILVDKEELCDRVEGVMNLSKDYGQLGTLWVTNLRISWAASLQENYNCSVPFIQVKALKSQQTKFGTVLVVETLPQPQRLLLGFQINPPDKLQELLHFTSGLLQKNRSNPEFGICAAHIIDPDVLEAAALEEEEPSVPDENHEDEDEDESALPGDGLAAYYAEEPTVAGEIVFDDSIGLTVEAMRGDVTLKSLWSVL